jgi:hypothetical protein
MLKLVEKKSVIVQIKINFVELILNSTTEVKSIEPINYFIYFFFKNI